MLYRFNICYLSPTLPFVPLFFTALQDFFVIPPQTLLHEHNPFLKNYGVTGGSFVVLGMIRFCHPLFGKWVRLDPTTHPFAESPPYHTFPARKSGPDWSNPFDKKTPTLFCKF